MMHHNAFTLYAKCYLSATAAYDLCKIWWPGPKRLNVLSVSNLYFAYVPPTFYLRPVHVPFVFDALNQILNANFYVRPADRNLMYATTTATTNPPESSNMTNYTEPTQMVNLLQKKLCACSGHVINPYFGVAPHYPNNALKHGHAQRAQNASTHPTSHRR